MRPLSPKQARFVDEYTRHLNGAKAARLAGYSLKNSDVAAAKLMRKPHVRAAIDARLQQERDDRQARERRRGAAQRAAILGSVQRRLRSRGR